MPDNPHDQPEKHRPNHENEVDRYEKLQIAAERQINNIGVVYEKHAALIKTVVLVMGSLAGLVVAIGTFSFYHSMSEFKQSIRQSLEGSMSAMTNTMDQKLALAIDERFRRENIEPLIETKVQGSVDLVTDRIIDETIHRQIDPILSQITNDLAQTKKTSAEVKSGLDVAINVVAALNDDRNGFNKLIEMRDSCTNQYLPTVLGAINAILRAEEVEDIPYSISQMGVTGFSFATNDWNSCINFYNQFSAQAPGSLLQAICLQKISEQDRFQRASKLELYRELLSSTPSLRILSRTCKILSKESNLNMNILGTPVYLKWISHTLNQIDITNWTDKIHTNQADATLYMMRALAYSFETNNDSAVKDFKMAISLNPTNSDALNSYAWFISVCPDDSIRNGKLAVELSTKACELTQWKQWNCVGTLAAACAESGDFERAIKYEQQAIGTVGISGTESDKEKARLKLFEQNKPTHEPQERP